MTYLIVVIKNIIQHYLAQKYFNFNKILFLAEKRRTKTYIFGTTVG